MKERTCWTRDEESTILALLHDVVEDHPDEYPFERLEAEGFGDAVMEALRLLTHENGMPYMDYIRGIKTNPLATKVKLADLAHNSDEGRLDHALDDKDRERLEKYRRSIALLKEVDEE